MNRQQLIKSGEGKNYPYQQDHCFVKLSSKNTNGELCIVEDSLKPGFHLKRHHHKIMTEVFYMLEGSMKLIFDNETLIINPGDTLTVPPNTWHEAYCENGGKMITIFKNGSFDEFLEGFMHMDQSQFEDEAYMRAYSEQFDIYEQ
ncbi:cupin domain-containing protein [Flavobacteriaceae bacterium]|nr:cupin domain-containing protein [Flavobacteriaceae bacterium]